MGKLFFVGVERFDQPILHTYLPEWPCRIWFIMRQKRKPAAIITLECSGNLAYPRTGVIMYSTLICAHVVGFFLLFLLLYEDCRVD